METGDRAALREELGDLLLQVVFHARVAQEHPTDPFTIDDVAAGVAAKLRRRHPHVFGEVTVTDADEVHRNWERIKRAEKARESALDGIPPMPALVRAEKVAGRARRAGLSVDDVVDALGERADDAAGIGRDLLAVALRAQAAGIDAESALRGVVRDLEAGLRAAERAHTGSDSRQ